MLQIDHAALEQQIAERKAREEEQCRRDKELEQKHFHYAQMALLFEKKINEVSNVYDFIFTVN
jgi:hypothetical protein